MWSVVVLDYVRRFPPRFQHRLLNVLERVVGVQMLTARTEDNFFISLDRRDLVQRQILMLGYWDREVAEAFKATLKPEDVFYDVGANIGYFSLLAASIGVGRVVAFEPLEELAQRAEGNVALNGFGDVVRVVHLALGDALGSAQYEPGPDWNSGAGRILPKAVPREGVTVQVTTLDDFLSETESAPPTVMKIDVEGFESKVLRGARQLLEERPPRVIVFEGDCSPEGELEDREVSRILENAGYRIRHLPRSQSEPKENFMAVLE